MFDLDKLWYSISQGLMKLIDAINSVFYWLAGIRPASIAPGMEYKPSIDDNTILNDVFNRPEVGKIFIFFAGLGIGILGIATVIGLIKTSINQKDQVASKKQLLMKSASSLFWVIAMPVLFLAAVFFVSVLLNMIVFAMSSTTGTSGDTLGTIIGKACMPDGIDEEFVTHFNAMTTTYTDLKRVGANEGFNYLMCILSSACVLVGLVIVCFTVVERLIHLIFLYVISPFVLAKAPLDEGKSFDQWKELALSKFLGLAGIIVCMYLFFLLMPVINEWFKYTGSPAGATADQAAWHKFALIVAKIVFIVAGVFTFTKAGTLFAHLVSSASGQFEGMSQMQSTGMLGMGGMLGAKLLGKASQGARLAVGGGTAALGQKGGGGIAQAAASLLGGGNAGGVGGVAQMGMTGGAAAQVAGIPGASPLTGAGSENPSGMRQFGGSLRSGIANTGRVIAGAGIISGLAYGAGRLAANTLKLGGKAAKGVGRGIGKVASHTPLVGRNGAGSGGVSLPERLSISHSHKVNSATGSSGKRYKAAQQQHNQESKVTQRMNTLNQLAQKHPYADTEPIKQMREHRDLSNTRSSVSKALNQEGQKTNKDGGDDTK